MATFCIVFVCFDSLHPINNLSVKQGQVFLGWTSTKVVLSSRTVMQWCWWGSNLRPFGLESSTLPLSHCAPILHSSLNMYLSQFLNHVPTRFLIAVLVHLNACQCQNLNWASFWCRTKLPDQFVWIWHPKNQQICPYSQLCVSVYQFMSLIEPVHEISNNVVYATSKASDQPAHMRSLIRAFAIRLHILWLLSYWLNITWSFSA